MVKVSSSFFENKTTLQIAKELIGKVFVYEKEGKILKGIISETEAYLQNDESCHAFSGKTKRNEVMFKSAGHLYVYFTYGMHFCCNIVTNEKDIGEAVLIRAVIPIKGKDIMIKNRGGNFSNIADGPAKFCQAFEIDKSLNGINLLDEQSKIYIEDLNYKAEKIFISKRIGISKAKDFEYRFYAKKFKNENS